MHNKNSRIPDLQAQVCLSGALTSYWACGLHSLMVNYTSLSSNPCQFKVFLSLAFPQGCPRIHPSFSHHFIGMLHLYHVFCILVSHPFLVLYCPFPASAVKIYFILLHFFIMPTVCDLACIATIQHSKCLHTGILSQAELMRCVPPPSPLCG